MKAISVVFYVAALLWVAHSPNQEQELTYADKQGLLTAAFKHFETAKLSGIRNAIRKYSSRLQVNAGNVGNWK